VHMDIIFPNIFEKDISQSLRIVAGKCQAYETKSKDTYECR
jgi:hypothetical protein